MGVVKTSLHTVALSNSPQPKGEKKTKAKGSPEGLGKQTQAHGNNFKGEMPCPDIQKLMRKVEMT